MMARNILSSGGWTRSARRSIVGTEEGREGSNRWPMEINRALADA
jgi:hypothetical protein